MITTTLSSGIKCFIVPKKGYVEKQAMIAVRFGSATEEFSVDGKQYKIPQGTAHFIEHKMFEMKNGNIFQAFSELGATANAYTTFDATTYYFTCTDNFYNNLELLIKMISTPYFTKESIESEKNIIAREINMYQDDSNWQCYFNLLSCLYAENPVKNGIAGTIDEINKIDENLLMDCYNTFYTPDNICLIVVGDVDVNTVINISEATFKLPENKKIKFTDYPYTPVDKSFIETYIKSVKTPVFYLGFKGDATPITVEDIVLNRIMIDYIGGNCSELYQNLLDKSILQNPMGFEYLKGKCYSCLMLYGNSTAPKEVLKMFFEQIEKIKAKKTIDKDIFDIVKKQRGQLIIEQDNINSICTTVADCFVKGIEYLDICNLYDKIIENNNTDDLAFDFFASDNVALSVVSGNR